MFAKIQHFQYKVENFVFRDKGAITIASIYDEENHSLEYTVAYCNPHDQFNKKIGRELAIDRITYNRPEDNCRKLHINNRSNVTSKLFTTYILIDILLNGKNPSWVKELIDHNLPLNTYIY